MSWHKVSPLPIPPLALHTSLNKGRSRNNDTSHTIRLVPFLGLRIGPACDAGLSAGMRRERVPPQKKKERKKDGFLHELVAKL